MSEQRRAEILGQISDAEAHKIGEVILGTLSPDQLGESSRNTYDYIIEWDNGNKRLAERRRQRTQPVR